MASFLRRQDDLQNLRVRNLQLQSTNGIYPADQSILTISGTTGYVVTSSSITVQNLTTCGITAANGNFTVVCPTGNTDISANLQVNGYINQGNSNIGTNYINLDGIGNPNIQIVAQEGGDGQAYFDLVTQKLTTSTNQHLVRSIVGNTGAFTLFHETGAPGLPTTRQQMFWDAAGSYVEFVPGNGLASSFITGLGSRSSSFTTETTTPDIPINLNTLSAVYNADLAMFPNGTPITIRFNVTFKDGGTFFFPTCVDVCCYKDSGIVTAILGNGTQPAGWMWSVTVTSSTFVNLQITPNGVPVPSLSYTARANYTIMGGQ